MTVMAVSICLHVVLTFRSLFTCPLAIGRSLDVFLGETSQSSRS